MYEAFNSIVSYSYSYCYHSNHFVNFFRLGSDHDGVEEGASTACADLNYVMAAIGGSETNFANRYLFSCCLQRSFYGTISKYVSSNFHTKLQPKILQIVNF